MATETHDEAEIRAPLNRAQTGPDISRADYFYALLCAQRGWNIDDVAARLMELSTKARKNGEQYARIIVENAAAASPELGDE